MSVAAREIRPVILAALLILAIAAQRQTGAADDAVAPSITLASDGVLSQAVAERLRPVLPLRVPVDQVRREDLVDSFEDRRGTDRVHEALDIPASRGTPVHAVDDGEVVKLFLSKPGGLTVYQFDRTRSVVYYYAHLDRYAEGLAEGQVLHRGDAIGAVGSTGNANPATPHLHFAVFELGPERQWWKGRAVNPLPLFGSEPISPR